MSLCFVLSHCFLGLFSCPLLLLCFFPWEHRLPQEQGPSLCASFSACCCLLHGVVPVWYCLLWNALWFKGHLLVFYSYANEYCITFNFVWNLHFPYSIWKMNVLSSLAIMCCTLMNKRITAKIDCIFFLMKLHKTKEKADDAKSMNDDRWAFWMLKLLIQMLIRWEIFYLKKYDILSFKRSISWSYS